MSTTASPHPRNARTASIVVAAALLVAGLAGGYVIGHLTTSTTSDTSGTTIGSVAAEASATGHDEADIAFAQQMIPHHEQAVEMAELATTRASSSDVKALATTIEAAQQPEIDRMDSWLTAWGASTGQASGQASPDGGMDMGSGTGMMSASDMNSLSAMRGTAFDTAFLTMMQQHHAGAVAMAQAELADGQNAQALALAASIIVTQTAEIGQMQAMLR